MENIRTVSDPREDSTDAAFVRDGLAALFNVATTGGSYYSPLAILLNDERGAVLGEALGHVRGGCLDLASLGVTGPLSGQGHGEKLFEAAEEDPARRDAGASVAQVDVVPSVQRVRVGQNRETGVPDDDGRRAHGEDGAASEVRVLVPAR